MNYKQKKISIVIPVYNCASHIENCLYSILNQHYKNIEVVIVNDGSTDDTLQIVKRISLRDNRVKVVNKKNGGVSEARNVGLKKCTGDYIGFVDADDYIESNMYFEMVRTLEKEHADVCLIAYYEIINGIKNKCFFPWENFIKKFNKEEVCCDLIPKMISKRRTKKEISTIFASVWRALIKADLIKKVQFDDKLPIGEDFLFLTDCLLMSNKVVTINDCVYNYIKNQNSATERYKADYDEINYEFHSRLLERLNKINFFESEDSKIRYGLNRFKVYTLSCSNIVKEPNVSLKKLRLNIKKTLLKFENENSIDKNTFFELDFKNKIIYILFRFRCANIITLLFIGKEKYKKKVYR